MIRRAGYKKKEERERVGRKGKDRKARRIGKQTKARQEIKAKAVKERLQLL